MDGARQIRPRRALALAMSVALAAPASASARSSVAPSAAIAGPGASGLGYLTPMVVASKSGDLTFVNLDVAEHNLVHDARTDGFGGPNDQPWCERPKKKSKKSKKRGKRQRKSSHGHHHDHGDGCPVFWSSVVGLGETTEVLGLENLEPGKSYSFFCTIHHNMTGTLRAID